MTQQASECLFIAMMVIGLANLILMPIITQVQLTELKKKIDHSQVCIDVIDNNIRVILEGDDPDPGDEDDEEEYSSNVVAIGRRPK